MRFLNPSNLPVATIGCGLVMVLLLADITGIVRAVGAVVLLLTFMVGMAHLLNMLFADKSKKRVDNHTDIM